MKNILISLPNDLKMLPVVMSSAKAYAIQLGFQEQDCGSIELMLEEALLNMIKYDFMPGQEEVLTLSLEHTTLGLGMRLHSNGVPLDVEEIQRYEQSRPETMLEQESAALGIYLISRYADRVSYQNQGKKGQEVWIEKFLPDAHIGKTENIQLEQAQAEVEQIHCDFYIRRMKPEEASVISRLAYYV
jgi:anti-sigma regulatory factor (Ser/Thr protein kinase)